MRHHGVLVCRGREPDNSDGDTLDLDEHENGELLLDADDDPHYSPPQCTAVLDGSTLTLIFAFTRECAPTVESDVVARIDAIENLRREVEADRIQHWSGVEPDEKTPAPDWGAYAREIREHHAALRARVGAGAREIAGSIVGVKRTEVIRHYHAATLTLPHGATVCHLGTRYTWLHDASCGVVRGATVGSANIDMDRWELCSRVEHVNPGADLREYVQRYAYVPGPAPAEGDTMLEELDPQLEDLEWLYD